MPSALRLCNPRVARARDGAKVPRIPSGSDTLRVRTTGQTPMEERIVELEIRVAYQDKVIADLDEVVRAFTERVEKLERELEELKETALAGGPEVGPSDDPPPHY
jgi:SlyX protein